MTDTITIHSGPLSMFGAKAEMAAEEKGIRWQRVLVPFSLANFYQPRSRDVLRINPKQQVPVLVDGDLEIFDSTQIFEYLEDLSPTPPLWPADRKGRARARLLELKSDEVFFPEVFRCFPHIRADNGEKDYEEAVGKIHEYFAEMDGILEEQTFLAGDFSYADIAFYGAQFFARFLGHGAEARLVHLERWRQTMNGRPSVQKVMGEMAQYLTDNGLPASI